jgi:hypothetical protein
MRPLHSATFVTFVTFVACTFAFREENLSQGSTLESQETYQTVACWEVEKRDTNELPSLPNFSVRYRPAVAFGGVIRQEIACPQEKRGRNFRTVFNIIH